MFKILSALILILTCTLVFSIDTSVKEPVHRQDPFTGTALTVPGVIQAEDYDEGGEKVAFGRVPGKSCQSMAYRFDGMNIRPASDIGGGYYVSGIEKGEWLEYTVTIPESAHYQVSARLASEEEIAFGLAINGKDEIGPQGFVSTGKSWKTVNVPWVHLPAGTHVLRVSAEKGVFDLNWLSIVKAVQSPFTGTPWQPSGQLQAENFDNGGQYISYYDTTAGNICYYAAYRFTDVDVENNPVNPSTINVGWIDTNEWLEYTVNIPQSGNYLINIAAATPNYGNVKIEFDGLNDTIRYLGYRTSSNQQYALYGVANIYLTQGQKVFRVTMLQPAWNLDSIWIYYVPNPPAAAGEPREDFSKAPVINRELN